MTRLFIIRHGQSITNIDKIFTGRLDSPLSDLGIMQAEKTAEYIVNNYHIDKVYASDLKRAFKTGEIVAEKFGIDAIPVPELREICGGVWEGMVFDDVPVKYPEEYAVWKNDLGSFCAIDGESAKEVYDRISKAIIKIAEENDGKNVAIACHAFAIRTFLCYARGKGVEELQNSSFVTNSSISIMEYDKGNFDIIQMGFDGHLEGMQTALPKTI